MQIVAVEILDIYLYLKTVDSVILKKWKVEIYKFRLRLKSL